MSESICSWSSQSQRIGYYDDDVTCLNAGVPGPDILKRLPVLMVKGTTYRMDEEMLDRSDLFQYGVEEGDEKFRNALSKFLSIEYGDKVESKNLILTAGASSALWHILTILFKPGVFILVEDTTYFIAIKMFHEYGATIVPVKTDCEGIIIEDLTLKLKSQLPSTEEDSSTFPFRAILYLIPAFHNPTGRTMSEERCYQITETAASHHVLIVCDDVYNLLHHGPLGSAPVRLFSCTRHENVISNGSFSKFLAPGLRLGWLEAPNWMVERYKKWSVVDSGGGLNTYTAGIVASLIYLGLLHEHVDFIRQEFKRRMLTLKKALMAYLPEDCSIVSPCNGGYYLWIELPKDVNAKCLQEFSKKEYRVNFLPGENTSPLACHNNYMRLSVSMYNEEVLEAAAKRLSQAIANYRARFNTSTDPNSWKGYAE